MTYPNNVILFGNKKKCYNFDEPAKWKKSITKEHILNGSIYIEMFRIGKFMEIESRLVVAYNEWTIFNEANLVK